VAQKTLSSAGIPTIEQVGGDVDLLVGKRATFVATPWKFKHGDACPVRFVGMMDPTGKCRIDKGDA
jgi:kynurenine formamidase